MLQLIACDLDGTLLTSTGAISNRTRTALRAAEAHGLHVLTITARPPRRVQAIAEACGLTGLAICSNGSVVYDCGSGQLLREHRLSMDVAKALIARLRAAAPGVAFAIEAGAQYGCEPTFAHSVAVANAHPSVLAAASEQTSSNDDDGVALVLERLAQRGYCV